MKAALALLLLCACGTEVLEPKDSRLNTVQCPIGSPWAELDAGQDPRFPAGGCVCVGCYPKEYAP